MLNAMTETQTEEALILKKHPEETKRMRKWLDEKIKTGKKSPITEIVSLTPILAQLLLEKNTRNRPINRRNKSEMVQNIEDKRFIFNGESIIVAASGMLNDGQHRCEAVIETGIPIQTVMVFGVPEDSRLTVDSGKSKTTANYLAMEGRNYVGIIGPAISYYLQYSAHQTISFKADASVPSKAAILEAADELTGIDDSASFTAGAAKTVRSHAVLTFCHYLIWKRVGRGPADTFIRGIIDGEGLHKGEPIYYCRQKLIGFEGTVRADVRAELILKCWNAFRSGNTKVTSLVITGKLPALKR